MATAAGNEDSKGLSEVSSKLSTLNSTTNSRIGNMEVLTKTLVDQSKAQLEQQEAVASGEAEARKEASRARKDKAGAQDVNVLNWQETKDDGGGGFMSMLSDLLGTKMMMGGLTFGSLFKKGGIKALLATFGTTMFAGIKTAFAAVGAKATGLLGPTLMKFLSPMALITGLVLAIKDGISGMASSMDWGVSKISGFLGGFFAGEADGGIMNMFKNAGKWALIGAGIGSVVPVIGTLVGGLVGGAIGGILGLIGAKKIAKAFDKIGAWFKKAWMGITKFIGEVWDKVKTWFTELWTWASGGIAAGWTNLTDYLSGIWTSVKEWFMGLWSWASEGIAAGWTGLTGFISEKWQAVKTWFVGLFDWASEGLAAGWTGLTGFVSEKWEAIKTWFSNLLTFESESGEKVGLVDKVLEMFNNMIDSIIEGVKGMIPSASDLNPFADDAPKDMTKAQRLVEANELDAKIKAESAKPAAGTGGWFTDERDDESIAKMKERLAAIRNYATGGLVKETGMAMLHGTQAAPELILDNQAASLFMQAATTLAALQNAKLNLQQESSMAATAAPISIVNQPTHVAPVQHTALMPGLSIRPDPTNTLPVT